MAGIRPSVVKKFTSEPPTVHSGSQSTSQVQKFRYDCRNASRLLRTNPARLPTAGHGDGNRLGTSPWARHTTGVHRRLLLQVLHGASDANIRFSDLTLLLRDL